MKIKIIKESNIYPPNFKKTECCERCKYILSSGDYYIDCQKFGKIMTVNENEYVDPELCGCDDWKC